MAQGSRKKIEKKNAKRLKLQAKKKKNVGNPVSGVITNHYFRLMRAP
jgi:hypothetical protein